MPVFAATDHIITLGTTNFSNLLTAVTLDISAEEQDTTAFGSTYRTRIAGLRDATLTLDFNQDFAAGAVDATLFPLLGSTISFAIRPTSATVSATNPSYSGTCLVTQYQPFASNIGDLATLSVSWPVSGSVTRATA